MVRKDQVIRIKRVAKQRQLTDEEQERLDKLEAKAKEQKVKIKKIAKKWKADEDWVNEHGGFVRQGHMRRGASCPDGVNDMFSQDTTRTKGLKFLDKELTDAEAHATASRTPVVFSILDYRDRMDGIASMRIRDWLDLHGEG